MPRTPGERGQWLDGVASLGRVTNPRKLTKKGDPMHNSRFMSFGSAVLVVWLAACGSATPAASEIVRQEVPIEPAAQPAQAAPAEAPQQVAASGAIIYRTGADQAAIPQSARLIIKDGQIRLLVEDTDRAIDGVMQVVGDVGGYVLSSRVWYSGWGGTNYKYASLTIGVPAEDFERAIRRLRALALQVVDETSIGQDVTDEYVDLQSQVESLQATRERILEFLDQAKTVDEALKVNMELAAVEAQIEQVQGRINYLSGRSSFSTITVTLEPRLPELTPTPTRTLTPTRTPIPWDASETYRDARGALTSLYHGFADLAIWVVIFGVPFLAPFILAGWLLWLLIRRKPKNRPNP
ncbi:MAG: hypothetical protein A2Z30_03305 [Chloroflexi bacterium RBG_16_64_43]|nr:MAG: hypothetical protein A2Z30_03305 [Chloroflexi bacterium RBG_16_64_43]